MAVTWEPLVRLISNLEKAHPRGPGNIPGKFQSNRTGGRLVINNWGKKGMIRWEGGTTLQLPYIHLFNTAKSNKMAVTWETLVWLISNLEKAHPRVPGNIPGKFQSDRTGGRLVINNLGKNAMIRWEGGTTLQLPYLHLFNTAKSNKMAVTWEPLVRSISYLEKAHPRFPGNIPGKFQWNRTGGRRQLHMNLPRYLTWRPLWCNANFQNRNNIKPWKGTSAGPQQYSWQVSIRSDRWSSSYY